MASSDSGTVISGMTTVYQVKKTQHAAIRQQKMIQSTRPVESLLSGGLFAITESPSSAF